MNEAQKKLYERRLNTVTSYAHVCVPKSGSKLANGSVLLSGTMVPYQVEWPKSKRWVILSMTPGYCPHLEQFCGAVLGFSSRKEAQGFIDRNFHDACPGCGFKPIELPKVVDG